MKTIILLGVSASLLLAGCDKKPAAVEVPGPNPATTAAPGSTPPPTPIPATVTTIAADTTGAADLPALSRTLRGWIVGHRRLPASFEEFVTTANLNVPPPPPGKKYAIQKSTVVLVNQ